jgi:hypothetical protein
MSLFNPAEKNVIVADDNGINFRLKWSTPEGLAAFNDFEILTVQLEQIQQPRDLTLCYRMINHRLRQIFLNPSEAQLNEFNQWGAEEQDAYAFAKNHFTNSTIFEIASISADLRTHNTKTDEVVARWINQHRPSVRPVMELLQNSCKVTLEEIALDHFWKYNPKPIHLTPAQKDKIHRLYGLKSNKGEQLLPELLISFAEQFGIEKEAYIPPMAGYALEWHRVSQHSSFQDKYSPVEVTKAIHLRAIGIAGIPVALKSGIPLVFAINKVRSTFGGKVGSGDLSKLTYHINAINSKYNSGDDIVNYREQLQQIQVAEPALV